MKKNAVLLWVVYFLNLMVFPAFFIRYTSSGPSVDTNAYLILQLVSTAIGVALFREKLVEGFKKLHQASVYSRFGNWIRTSYRISNCGRSVYWRCDVGQPRTN